MVRFVAAACIALLAAGAVQAQTRYTCRTPGGSTVISDLPCSGSSNQVTYGAVPPPPAPRYNSIGQAPSHLQFMSPRCASLNDALRTGYARGLKSETMATMRRDYQNECSEDEREAQQEMYRARTADRNQRMVARAEERKEAERARQREQQCGEAKRILAIKKARTDLNEGEKADLRRFEENLSARCS